MGGICRWLPELNGLAGGSPIYRGMPRRGGFRSARRAGGNPEPEGGQSCPPYPPRSAGGKLKGGRHSRSAGGPQGGVIPA
ncbi:MAG: hypothetical protein FJY67_02830 [Calditrichaeota bacterium]|nr:hypothetical protein [Calditrichota bacterium]